jgi:CHASE2 domain-containing sensor protein
LAATVKTKVSFNVRIDKKMESNRKITWFFVILLCLLGIVSILASIAKQSWIPVIAFIAILLTSA